MAQALQLRRRAGTSVAEPRACPDCLRRAWLLALLGPYIERIATGARRLALARTAAASPIEDLAAVAAPKVAAQLLGRVGGRCSERELRRGAGGGRLLGLLSPRRPLPGLAARRRRRSLGLDRRAATRRCSTALEPFGAVTIVGARRATSYGREIARELGARAGGAGMIVVSGLAFGIDGCAHRGALDAGGGRSPSSAAGRTSPTRPPTASLWRRIGESRPGDLRAAAGRLALALDLPGPQPDHGGAGRDDRRRRGGGALRLADHRRPGGRPRPRPRRRPRAGHLARLGRPQQPARWRRLSWSATPRTCSTRCSGRARSGSSASAVGPRPRAGRGPRRGRRAARAAATASPPPSASAGRRGRRRARPPRAARLRHLLDRSGLYSRTLLAPPSSAPSTWSL